MKRPLLVILLISFFSTFIYAADYYWIGGTGDWSQISNWATSSGGSTLHSSVPGTNDNVIFDANSFSANGQTVTLDVAVNIKNMDWSGISYTVTLDGSVSPTIYGDLLGSNDLTWDAGSYIYLKGIGDHDFDPAGMVFTQYIYFQDTGTYSLQDSLITSLYVYIHNRTFNSNGHKISATIITTDGVSLQQTINLSTSKIYGSRSIYSAIVFGNSNLTLDADSTEFYLTGNGGGLSCSSVQDFYIIEFTSTSSTYTDNLGLTNNCTLDSFICNSSSNTTYIYNSIDISYFITRGNLRIYADDSIHYAEVYGDIETLYNSDVVFDTLMLTNNSNGQIYSLNSSGTFTVNDSLYVAPGTCSAPITIKSSSTTIPTSLIVKNGSVNLDYAYITNVTATGGANFNGTNIIEESGNSGWTISDLNNSDFYWIGGSGEWDDATNWSHSSGGTPISSTGCYPRYNDDVIFDNNSFSATNQYVDVKSPEECHSMTWTNTPYLPTFRQWPSASFTAYGDVSTHDSMSWVNSNSSANYIYFSSDSTQNIDFGGTTLDHRITFNGTGTYELQDSIRTYNVIEINSGTFNSNDHKIYCRGLGSVYSTANNINLGESILEIWYYTSYTKSLNITNQNSSLDLDSTTIVLTGASPQLYTTGIVDIKKVIAQGVNLNLKDGSTVDTIIVNGSFLTLSQSLTTDYIYSTGEVNVLDLVNAGKAEIYDDFTVSTLTTPVFDTLLFYDNDEARTYNFRAGATFSIVDSVLFPVGNCTNTHTLKSSSDAGTLAARATISKPNGYFNADYYVVNSINGTGGATFIIDNLVSTDGNTNNLTLNDLGPFNLYWVGGTGYWDSASNWSLTSGGTPQGSNGCLPDENINAVFDANSFSAAGQTVYFNSGSKARNLIWDGVTNDPTFKDTLSFSDFTVYGSLELDPNMNLEMSYGFRLAGTDTFTIDLGGQRLNRLTIEGNDGYYNMLDSICVKNVFYHNEGGLNTNGHQIRTNMYYCSYNTSKYATLDLDTSWFICDSTRNNAGFYAFDCRQNSSRMTIDADSAVIWLRGTKEQYASFRTSTSDTFRKIIHNASAYYLTIGSSSFIDTVIYNATSASRISSRIDLNYVESQGELSVATSNITINKLTLYNDLNVIYDVSIDTLQLYSGIGKRTYTITGGKTIQVLDSIHIDNGSCEDKHKFTSSSIGSLSYLDVDSGYVPLDHFSIFSVYARGDANFSATNTYETDGRDSGWNVQYAALDTLYWIGGTGSWKDAANWSLTSGGSAISSDCIPGGRTTVIFDENSFSSSSQTVSIDTIASCYSFLTAGATGTPNISGSEDLFVYGSFYLTDSINFLHTGDLYFNGFDTTEIKFDGNKKTNASSYIYFDGGAVYNQLDSLESDGYLSIERGEFNSNSNKIHARRVMFQGNEPLEASLGTSKIEGDFNSSNSTASFYINHSNLQMDADETTIKLIGNSSNLISCNVPGNDLVFNRVETYGSFGSVSLGNAIVDSVLFYGSGGSYYYSADTANYIFSNSSLQIRGDLFTKEAMMYDDLTSIYTGEFYLQHATVYGNLYLGADATFDTLILLNEGPSTIHKFNINDTCRINDSLYINSNGCYKTTLQSINTSSTAYIKMPATSGLFGQYLEIESLYAFGGGDFNVGVNSSDLGGNTGWDFTGPSYDLQLKFQYVCIDTPGVATVQAVPDGFPVNYWWKETVSPFDTFNTGIDTIMVTGPGNHVFVIQYGTNCNVEDSIFVRVAAPANGVEQTFGNNAGDNSWFNCSNWTGGLIPDSVSNAIIGSGDTVILQSGEDAYCNNLTNNGYIKLNGGNLFIHGNLTMNGEVLHDNGSFVFSGSGTDSISSSSVANLDSVDMDKDGYVVIISPTKILGYLNCLDGYIQTTSADSLIFEDGATTSGGSDESFVLGPVYKRGENAFIFPIGDSSILAQIEISSPSSSGSNTFKAEYFYSPHSDTVNIVSPIVKISSVEFWQLDRIAGSGSVRISLYYNDSARSYIVDPQYLHVGRYDGSDWNSEGQNTYSASSGTGVVQSDWVSTFSPFTFAATNGVNPVPVDFLNIEAEWSAQDALIYWQTASEKNNDYFIVERSVNGLEFSEVGRLNSLNGNSTEIQSYTFTDQNARNLASNAVYYRIKQVDYNGEFSFSDIVQLSIKNEITLIPNPAKDVLFFQGIEPGSTIEVYSITGELVDNVELSPKQNRLDISSYANGSYIVRVIGLTKISHHKITVSR